MKVAHVYPAATLLTVTFNAELSADDEGPPIKFERIVRDAATSPPCEDSLQQLVCCEVECPSNIGRQDPAEVEVDFANKDVGFGPGGTQEEILFGMTPEVGLRSSVRLRLRVVSAPGVPRGAGLPHAGGHRVSAGVGRGEDRGLGGLRLQGDLRRARGRPAQVLGG